MSKFHINKHGVPAPCKATKGNCPLGGDEQHFDNYADAQAYADKTNEADHSILPGVNSGRKYFKKPTGKQKELRDDIVNRTIRATLGHSSTNNDSFHERKNNYEHFVEDGGLKTITDVFDDSEENFEAGYGNHFDPKFDVEQNLLYYFPRPDNEDVRSGGYLDTMSAYNNQSDEDYEKSLEDANDAILDLHEIMEETKSQPLIRRKLAEKNEDRVFDRFSDKHEIKSDRPSGKFFDKNIGKHASKVFADMASDPKFYRYAHNQAEAEGHYARTGTKITNYNEDVVAQKAAFELAKEFHDNKVLNGVLNSDNKQIVNRMKKRLEEMFPIED